jgi:hypothetical protein
VPPIAAHSDATSCLTSSGAAAAPAADAGVRTTCRRRRPSCRRTKARTQPVRCVGWLCGPCVGLHTAHSAPPPPTHTHPPTHTTLRQEEFVNPDALWQKAQDADGGHRGWYAGAVAYWDAQEASYDGVLGGFGHVSPYDIADSRSLLQRVRRPRARSCDARPHAMALPAGVMCLHPRTRSQHTRCFAHPPRAATGDDAAVAGGSSRQAAANSRGCVHVVRSSLRGLNGAQWCRHGQLMSRVNTHAPVPPPCRRLALVHTLPCRLWRGRGACE